MLDKKPKVIFLMGVPGSGKTWLFKKLLQSFGKHQTIYRPGYCFEMFKLQDTRQGYMLGKYDSHTFSGTDRLSMSCQPLIKNFIRDTYNGVFLIEGDRLCNKKFFDFCKENANLKLFFLNTVDQTLAERRIERNVIQSPSWLKGRFTKVYKLLQQFEAIVLDTSNEEKSTLSFQLITDELNA